LHSTPTPLARVRVIPIGSPGPEDVFVHDGTVITGVQDGRILRVHPDSGRVDTLGDTQGRPLGLEPLPDGRVLICDSYRGLLALDPGSGKIETLMSEYGGQPLRFCNNAAVAADGTVYFSDSSRRFSVDRWRHELIEHVATGRLFRRTPSGEVDVVADDLQFANGVALAPDESYALVAETGAYRIRRVWLAGERAGRSEVFAELPGFPDNLSSGSDGLTWVAVASLRDPVFSLLRKAPRPVRRAAAALPERLQPSERPVMRTQALDLSGRVVHDLAGPGDQYHFVTGVREADGRLWFGSLAEPAIAVADLPTG
jgi:sugar lactone lactonase YvrE